MKKESEQIHEILYIYLISPTKCISSRFVNVFEVSGDKKKRTFSSAFYDFLWKKKYIYWFYVEIEIFITNSRFLAKILGYPLCFTFFVKIVLYFTLTIWEKRIFFKIWQIWMTFEWKWNDLHSTYTCAKFCAESEFVVCFDHRAT